MCADVAIVGTLNFPDLMNKKFLLMLLVFTLLTLGGAAWQAREAASLDARLTQIDRQAQLRRLVELSLPRVQAEMDFLLTQERSKLGDSPLLGATYEMPEGGKADWNCGFFFLSPAGLMVPEGEEAFGQLLNSATPVIDTIRRKAFNPAAPVYDVSKPTAYDPRTQLPVFGVFDAIDPDFEHPMELKGVPGPFFAWHYKDNLVYMRCVPTTHGSAAEGFIIDSRKLAEHLLPLVEPGLKAPEIGLIHGSERANLAPLPLVLRSGNEVDLPDTAARRDAIGGMVLSSWWTALCSIVILFALLAFYARLERRRSDFVSAVTHELRTPLTSFQLMTEMLHHKLVPAEKVEEYHKTLYAESRRLSHLVENVLAFARLTRGKARGRLDSGPCRELLRAQFDKVADRLRAEGFRVTVTQDKHTDLIALKTDLISLEQILTNLADNAVKYAKTAPKPAVTLSVVRKHDSLAIRFADNGPGVAQDVSAASLFRPFSRSARSDKGGHSGVGLGLALSRDIARSIGGELSLEKSDANGCTFLLTLPL